MVLFTHEQNIICTPGTGVLFIACDEKLRWSEAIIYRQLFVGHVMGFRPMKRRKISIQ